jgi:hypothetical protein
MINVNFPASFFKSLLGSAFGASADAIKLRLAIGYLKLVKNSRNLVIQMALLIFFIVILSFGFILIPVSLCLYMPWNTTVKAIVSLSFGLLYTIVPMIALMVAFSEKRWLSTSKLEKLINGK